MDGHRGDLAELEKNATQLIVFLPLRNKMWEWKIKKVMFQKGVLFRVKFPASFGNFSYELHIMATQD